MIQPHPLDRPIWSALASRQAHFDTQGKLARKFPSEVSPFIAARDTSEEAWADLVRQIPAEYDVSILEPSMPSAPVTVNAIERPLLQMIMTGQPPTSGKDVELVTLGDADAAEMLALATLTKPGPFRTRTHTMGRFFGIRDGARLVAMGGERLATDGFTEITALCTHPDYRGKAYGKTLLAALANRIISEGLTPFLHTYPTNDVAIAMYTRMGFEPRAQLVHAVWERKP
ncbi:GNAT family N-acetyltransferase [Hyphomonas oceanitis]|uniref:GNAT family N-acetyltransferase n=1 Tax=Hyphomonas oceanitis TaxID=81033 RepID=UPI0030032D28